MFDMNRIVNVCHFANHIVPPLVRAVDATISFMMGGNHPLICQTESGIFVFGHESAMHQMQFARIAIVADAHINTLHALAASFVEEDRIGEQDWEDFVAELAQRSDEE